MQRERRMVVAGEQERENDKNAKNRSGANTHTWREKNINVHAEPTELKTSIIRPPSSSSFTMHILYLRYRSPPHMLRSAPQRVFCLRCSCYNHHRGEDTRTTRRTRWGCIQFAVVIRMKRITTMKPTEMHRHRNFMGREIIVSFFFIAYEEDGELLLIKICSTDFTSNLVGIHQLIH